MSKILSQKEVVFDRSRYPLLIGRGIINELAARLAERTRNRDVLIVYDNYFEASINDKLAASLRLAGFRVLLHPLEGGKVNKNINEVLKIYGLLESQDFSRDSTLVAVGGGVVGDLGGFVASTYLRGINLVHIPTTLMAMIDSSLGGKVAINFRKTINAIGGYYHPIINLIDLDFIDALPLRDYRAGLAEAIKCAVIADAEYFRFLLDRGAAILEKSEPDLLRVIDRAIEIKIDHVSGDVHEGGKRLKLNYGHTLGHAVESSTVTDDGETYRHGEGVALGIMAAAYIAWRHLGLKEQAYQAQREIFDRYRLPVVVEAAKIGFERAALIDECLRNVKKDKKRKDHVIRMVLASGIGQSAIYNDVPFSLIEEAFREIVK
ncbi:3-dehydroquinate synthase [Candidatus Saganbacteria bacterium]|nr:3-dehydroquinate synthase [Candidatus Saganbacteria bacterium]